jgi:hypothetical protein
MTVNNLKGKAISDAMNAIERERRRLGGDL